MKELLKTIWRNVESIFKKRQQHYIQAAQKANFTRTQAYFLFHSGLKWLFWGRAIVSVFVIFILGLLVGYKFFSSENVLLKVYPTHEMVSDITDYLSKNDTQREGLRSSLFRDQEDASLLIDFSKEAIKSEFPDLRFEDLPNIKENFPVEMWNELETADKNKYEKWLDTGKLIDALVTAHRGKLNSILFNSSGDIAKENIRNTIKQLGKLPIGNIVLNTISDKIYEDPGTSCDHILHKKKKQATISYPNDTDKYRLWWFKCRTFTNLPTVKVKISTDDGDSVEDVTVVGEEYHDPDEIRGGIQLKVTDAVMGELYGAISDRKDRVTIVLTEVVDN